MDKINIEFEIEEIADILDLLDQGYSDGYINAGDPVLTAIEKLQDVYFKWKIQEFKQSYKGFIKGEYGSNKNNCNKGAL